MFTGIDFEKAIDYYRKGKEVIVLDRASVGKNGKSGYDTFPFEELFKDLDFLVDVPAVINPDFEQAVQGMTEADQVDPEEIIRAVHETQEGITPPPTEPEERMEEETIDLPADNIEDKKEKIRKLVEEGYTNREIADQTGIPFGTVGYHAARFRKKEKEPVDNSDRHLCKTCKFRSNRPTVNSCDYADLMKHSRGCKIEECTKYEKGARMKKTDVEE